MGLCEMDDEPFPNVTEPGELELNDEENHYQCPDSGGKRINRHEETRMKWYFAWLEISVSVLHDPFLMMEQGGRCRLPATDYSESVPVKTGAER